MLYNKYSSASQGNEGLELDRLLKISQYISGDRYIGLSVSEKEIDCYRYISTDVCVSVYLEFSTLSSLLPLLRNV
jgi:hypothetical protein